MLVAQAIISLLHFIALITGIVVLKKYEEYFQELKFPCVLNPFNLVSHKFWMLVFSCIVSAGLFIMSMEHIDATLKMVGGGTSPKDALMGILVGILIIQYHLFLLMDRRK